MVRTIMSFTTLRKLGEEEIDVCDKSHGNVIMIMAKREDR